MRIWVANVTVPVPAGVSTVWREGKGSASWYCPFCSGKAAQPRSGSCIQEYKAGMIILTSHKWFWACMDMGEIIVWLKCFAEENLLFPFWWAQRRAQKCGFFFFALLSTSGILSCCKWKFCWREALSSSSDCNFKRTHFIVYSVQKSATVCHKEMVHASSWLFVCPQCYYII